LVDGCGPDCVTIEAIDPGFLEARLTLPSESAAVYIVTPAATEGV
jgi:hypothetical protein